MLEKGFHFHRLKKIQPKSWRRENGMRWCVLQMM